MTSPSLAVPQKAVVRQAWIVASFGLFGLRLSHISARYLTVHGSFSFRLDSRVEMKLESTVGLTGARCDSSISLWSQNMWNISRPVP